MSAFTRTCTAIVCTLAFALPCFAGHEMIGKESKEVAPTPCYADHEWTVDVFGSYFAAETRKHGTNGDHGWGGGLDVNYYFARYFGLGVEGSIFDVDDRHNEFLNVNAYLRLPVEGKICFAPYIFGGGGWEWNDERNNLHGHAGLGVDFRLTPRYGFFTDARYTWTGGPRISNDFALIRTGFNVVF
jgi:hypothetical protein